MVYFFGFLGGLALFLYGMQLMGEGLQRAAGEKLQKILEKLTGVLPVAVALGAVVTGILQSSSATTVMTVGFVNAGLMNLKQAFGVVMGANIGTTMTEHGLIQQLRLSLLLIRKILTSSKQWQKSFAKTISQDQTIKPIRTT